MFGMRRCGINLSNPNQCYHLISRVAHRAFEGQQAANRKGRAAMTRRTYCGNLLRQSGPLRPEGVAPLPVRARRAGRGRRAVHRDADQLLRRARQAARVRVEYDIMSTIGRKKDDVEQSWCCRLPWFDAKAIHRRCRFGCGGYEAVRGRECAGLDSGEQMARI